MNKVYIVSYQVDGDIKGVDEVFNDANKAQEYCSSKNKELYKVGYLFYVVEKEIK